MSLPDSSNARAILLPPAASFAGECARLICERFGASAPDFSALTVITPSTALFAPLREALAHAAGGALLSPRFCTLDDLATGDAPVRSALACTLRLAEAVGRFRFLFPGQSPLRVAESLYALFDDMLRHGLGDLAEEAAFTARLQVLYGSSKPIAALSREAQIVHRLLRALQEELGDSIPALAESQALQRTLRNWPADQPLVFIGFDALRPLEIAAVQMALARESTLLIAQGRQQGRDAEAHRHWVRALGCQSLKESAISARSVLLDAAFDSEGVSLASRAASLQGRASAEGLQIVTALDPEHAAQCTDLAVREALLGGAQKITVLCEDRRLARRLRARLERAGIALADRGGWALSTSRAAATLDAWVSCIEADFPTRALLALLKSGFLPQGSALADALEPRAHAGQIAGGAARWREALRSSEERQQWRSLEAAARPLAVAGQQPASAHLEQLLHSLDAVGIGASFAADLAGARVMSRLHELQEALAGTTLNMQWRGFRALLDRCLEDVSFSTHVAGSAVELLTLSQTQGLQTEVLIVADAGPALTRAGQATPFFNASVRRELQLPGIGETQALALARLRRVLEAAPLVQLIVAPEAVGEEALLAAPLLLLQAFAQAADTPLHANQALAARASAAEIAQDSSLPQPQAAPAPPATASLLQRPLSGTAHQRLIECPYAFHASTALQLSALKDYDAPPDARDYGQRVHTILHAFEVQQPRLPPPYQGARDASARAAIEQHLRLLGDAVFAHDVADRPLGRFWRQAFERNLPWLAEQLTQRPQAAAFVEHDLATERDGWQLKGRADRIDDDGDRRVVVDYKTGAPPSKADLSAGEAVQLPHYTLQLTQVAAIEYWDLKNQRCITLCGETLDSLLPQVAARLGRLAEDFCRGTPLPANGVEVVCERCDFSGVCRRGDWLGAAP